MAIPVALNLLVIAVMAIGAHVVFTRHVRRARVTAASGKHAVAVGLMMAALPLLALPAPPPWRAMIVGTEGVLEASTAGLQLALVTLAAARRLYPLAAGAFVLLLGELDYGMLFTGYPDPAPMQAPGMLPDRFNFHNGAGQGLWRLVPFATLLALSWPRIDTLAQRWRLPRLNVHTWRALPGIALAGLATLELMGPRAMDESMGLAFVALFLTAWPTCDRNRDAGAVRAQP